jgi:hypothetical protein
LVPGSYRWRFRIWSRFFPPHADADDDPSLSPSSFDPVDPFELDDLRSDGLLTDTFAPSQDQGAPPPVVTDPPGSDGHILPTINEDFCVLSASTDYISDDEDDATIIHANPDSPLEHTTEEEADVPADSRPSDTHEHHHAPAGNQGAEVAHVSTNQGAITPDPVIQPPIYNLRQQLKRTARLQYAMDLSHSGKSYCAPTQLTQLQEQCLIYGHVLTQMSAKTGIKKHGSAAVDAMMAEFVQLQNLHAYKPLYPKKLTYKQKRNALRSINLIKEKRDGRLKGRTVADGRPQILLYQKADVTSPTVYSDALLMSLLIDALEGRDVATADVVGAYLRAYMDDEVIMQFCGEFVDILLGMKPEYEEFVVYKMASRFYMYSYSKPCMYAPSPRFYGTSSSPAPSSTWV